MGKLSNKAKFVDGPSATKTDAMCSAVVAALDVFELVMSWTRRTVSVLARACAEGGKGSLHGGLLLRRHSKNKLLLQQWLFCLCLLERSRIEFLAYITTHHNALNWSFMRHYSSPNFAVIGQFAPTNPRHTIPVQLRELSIGFIRDGLLLFPNDAILLQYLVKDNDPGVSSTTPVLRCIRAVGLCEEILSKWAFMTGLELDAFFPLWETSLQLQLNQTSRAGGGEKYLRTLAISDLVKSDAAFDRLCHFFEDFVQNSAAGNQYLSHVWQLYISAMSERGCDVEGLRRLFYRAIHQCPWSKRVWMLAMQPSMRAAFREKELVDLQRVMEEKGIMRRVVL